MPTLEIMEKIIDVNIETIKKLEKQGLLKVENKVNPLLIEYNLYKLEVRKLIDQFLSRSDEMEELLKYSGSLKEYIMLKIISDFSVVSPDLVKKNFPQKISLSWINRLLNKLENKGYIKKIGKGLYQIDKKGENIIK